MGALRHHGMVDWTPFPAASYKISFLLTDVQPKRSCSRADRRSGHARQFLERCARLPVSCGSARNVAVWERRVFLLKINAL